MLTVGQVINSKFTTKDSTQENEWVVLELINQKNRRPRVRIRVEKVGAHMGTYLTLGKEYVLVRVNQLTDAEHLVYEVPAKQCKRTSSQVLLYDWPAKEGGPKMDIDF